MYNIFLLVLLILGFLRMTVMVKPPEGNAMNLKKSGAVLCNSGMVRMGARVDPECGVNMKAQLQDFSKVKFQDAYCEKGVCVVEYREKGVLAYVCRAESKNNNGVEGHCNITAPPGSNICFSPESQQATLKVFRRDEDMYY